MSDRYDNQGLISERRAKVQKCLDLLALRLESEDEGTTGLFNELESAVEWLDGAVSGLLVGLDRPEQVTVDCTPGQEPLPPPQFVSETRRKLGLSPLEQQSLGLRSREGTRPAPDPGRMAWDTLQKHFAVWHAETFGDPTMIRHGQKCLEEAAELFGACRSGLDGPVVGELPDVLLVLLVIAEKQRVSLHDLASKKLEELRRRCDQVERDLDRLGEEPENQREDEP